MRTKPLYFLVVTTLILGTVSCKKNYDHACKCEFPNGNPAQTSYFNDVTKEEAETRCANEQETTNTGVTDPDLIVTCKLKD